MSIERIKQDEGKRMLHPAGSRISSGDAAGPLIKRLATAWLLPVNSLAKKQQLSVSERERQHAAQRPSARVLQLIAAAT